MSEALGEISKLIIQARHRFLREAQIASDEVFQEAVILSRALGDISIAEAKAALVDKFKAELYKERE